MPGLSETDQGYAFDLYQGGRLAEARLSGAADTSVVRSFYSATLTQLGWRPTVDDPYVYHRGRERLVFLVEPRKPAAGRPAAAVVEAVFVVTPDARPAEIPASQRLRP